MDGILYAYRTRMHSTLKISPYELMFGIAPQVVGGSIKQYFNEINAWSCEERLYALMDQRLSGEMAAKKSAVIETQRFKVNDFVLRVRRKKKTKLDVNFWPMPYIVVETFPNTCRIMDCQGQLVNRLVNCQELKKFRLRNDT